MMSNDFTVKRGNSILISLNFSILFFYDNHQSEDMRYAILNIFDSHASLTGDVYRWTQNPTTTKWKYLPQSRASYIHPREWVPMAQEPWTFTYHGGPQHHDASDIVFSTYNRQETQDKKKVSYIYMRLPECLTEDPENLVKHVHNWASRLKPLHGYAGFGLGSRFSGFPGLGLDEYRIAQRYIGIDIHEPMLHSFNLGLGIKGVNWLTILGTRYVNLLGGMSAIEHRMGSLFIWPYSGGVVLQAGLQPLLGDLQTGEIMDAYRQVAAIVEPIRMKAHSGISVGKAPNGTKLFDKETYRQWLARFSPQPE